MSACFDHAMFGMCPRPNCGYSHEIEHANKQEFFVAQISQMSEVDNVVTLKLIRNSEQEFIIGKGHWHRNDAAQGDLVVFQTYTEKKKEPPIYPQKEFKFGKVQCNKNVETQGDLVVYQTHKIPWRGIENIIPKGRVLSVLCKNWSPNSVPCISINVKESAFTLDPIEAKSYDDALTIEDCKGENHSGCKKIGIHIVAASNQQAVSENDLSFYFNIKSSSRFKRNVNSLEKGNYRLAVSVYLHTAKDDASLDGGLTEPEFSVVKVTENYKIFYDQQEYLHHMEILWSHFKCFAYKKIAQTGVCKYLSSTPKISIEFFILHELMAAFNSGVRKLIKKLPGFKAHFITASDRVYQEENSDSDSDSDSDSEILVPEKFLTDALTCFGGNAEGYNLDVLHLVAAEEPEETFELALKCFVEKTEGSDLNILPFVAAGRMSQWLDSPDDFLRAYNRDVENCSNLKEKCVIKCTSPMRKIQHYLNQQILIHCMIDAKSEIYKRTELLGILGIRFRTPKKLLAVIKTLDETSFTVNYSGCQGINPEICKISYATLCGVYKFSREKSTICLKVNPYRKLVSCNKKQFNGFIKEFCGDRDLNKMKQYLEKLERLKKSQVSTYTIDENTTMIELQFGLELQLQISNDDAGEKNSLGLRLLYLGKNCHLCLLHRNHPELAFMSDRKDIRDQNLEIRIKYVTDMTKDEKLNTHQLKNVNITWSDKFFSGGIFIKTCEILPGDFLCIRKEISSEQNREGDAEVYVWNAHGIVISCIEGNVNFSVCTLSQKEKRNFEKQNSEKRKSEKTNLEEDFCVDIISTN